MKPVSNVRRLAVVAATSLGIMVFASSPGYAVHTVPGGHGPTTSRPSTPITSQPSTPRASACLALADLRARSQSEVSRRITALDQLLARLGQAPDPFGANTAQQHVLEDTKSALSALGSKIQGGCYASRDSAVTDVRSIFTSYRVFALRMPQTRLLIAADDMGAARTRLGAISAELVTLSTAHANIQPDVAAMQAALAVSDTNLGNPPVLGSAVAAVLTINPGADPSTALASAKAAHHALEQAHQALANARASAQHAVSLLKAE